MYIVRLSFLRVGNCNKKMEKLRLRLRKPNGSALFHDSRADSALFMKVFNALHDKVNEMIDENTELKERIKQLEAKANEA